MSLPSLEAESARFQRSVGEQNLDGASSSATAWLRERSIDAGIALAEHGFVPDLVLRSAVHAIVAERAEELRCLDEDGRDQDYADGLRGQPLALRTQAANTQHYEVPAAFFRQALGPHLKYSCGYWRDDEVVSLGQAEEAALELVAKRAEVEPGQSILDLGCGWGSFSLWVAERHPECRVTGLSNSNSQRDFIMSKARERGILNLEVLTADINVFDSQRRFDRIVSIEMFEHLRNYHEMFERLRWWLVPQGKLFVHVFSHRSRSYAYETQGASNWMARNFFTGGTMPSRNLLSRCSGELDLENSWQLDGTHYARTAEAWLENVDRNRATALASLTGDPRATSAVALQRWRMFFIACAEFFAFDEGREWGVTHHLFQRRNP